MRLDKFLKLTNVVKRRTVANEVASEGAIYVNDKTAKPSYAVKIGDIIKIKMWNYEKVVKVLQIPTKQVNKSDLDKYIEIISYNTIDIRDVIGKEEEEDIF
jgi:ribosomal 50S subunit-recycling heat shock protein